MFMDDIKLFGRGTREINTLVQTIGIVSGDIRMELGIEKYALINIQRGKVTRTEGLQLLNGNNIKDIDETGYKYFGIIEPEKNKAPGDEGEGKKKKKKKKKRIHKEIENKTKGKTQLWRYCESHKLLDSTNNQVRCRYS